MRILWLTNIPSPYRVKFFNDLGKNCELTVLFERRASEERDTRWSSFSAENFKAIILPGIKMGVAEAFCPSAIKYLNRKYDHVVVTNFSDFTGILAILWMKIRHIEYEVESDGAFPNYEKSYKDKIKKFLFSSAKRCFSTAMLNDEYYLLNGVSKEKIVRYPFTSVLDEDVLLKPVSKAEKLMIREKLKIEEKHVILAVGQFIHRKGFDVLIQAASYLNNDYGLYIIGGTPTEEYIKLIGDLNLTNIHFLPFQGEESLDQYYKAANVFVHPTREDIWGLVVNEAMAKGLPVVTTNQCIAGMEMIEENINGKIVPVDDEKALADAICYCVKDSNMARKSIEKALKFTIQNMSYKHLEVWSTESKNLRRK